MADHKIEITVTTIKRVTIRQRWYILGQAQEKEHRKTQTKI